MVRERTFQAGDVIFAQAANVFVVNTSQVRPPAIVPTATPVPATAVPSSTPTAEPASASPAPVYTITPIATAVSALQ